MRFAVFMLAITTLLLGCYTPVKDPGAFRERKKKTVGSGYMYNPSADWSIGVSYDFAEKPGKMALRIMDNGQSSRSVNEDAKGDEYRQISMTHQQYNGNAFMLRFPWRDSFFYYGMTTLVGYGRFGYNEKVTGYTLAERSANVEWEQYYADISFPIGFSVNYDKLGTFLCGIGPRRRLWTSRNFIDTGTHHNVDTTERDATIRAFDKETENIGIHFMGMWGYSF